MAYESELGNFIHQTDVVAGSLTEAFVTKDNVFPLIRTEVFPNTTNVIKFAKGSSLVAEGVSESTAYTFSASSELSDTATTVTGTKKMVASKLTLEALRFGAPYNQLERIGREQASALVRLAASELKTLFSSVATAVTASTVLTKDNLLDARYNVVKSTKGAHGPKLVGYFDYKGMNEIAKELTDTDASAFNAQVNLGVIGISQASGAKGELFDIVLFETDGLPTSGGDDVACVWDPGLAFVGGVDGINELAQSPEAAI